MSALPPPFDRVLDLELLDPHIGEATVPAVFPAAHRPAEPAGEPVEQQVWDLPLRLFHGGLILSTGTAILSAWAGGPWMPVHGWAGSTVLGLVGFRTIWGLVGTTQARFASFWPTPARLKAWWSGRWQGAGHSPLGALSVLAMLGLLAAQAGTGLFGTDEISFDGPLAARVDEALSLSLTAWHLIGARLVYVLLGLHVAAIGFYSLLKGKRLIGPMIHGRKRLPAATPARSTRLSVAGLLAALGTGLALALLPQLLR